MIKKSWVNNNYSSKDEKDFIANFKKYLDEKDHIKRADRLLWENKINEAKRTISFVSPIYRDLFNTRIALKQNKSGIAKLLKKVPNDLKNNPGLVFDRAVYRRKSKNFDGAATLLKSQESNKGVEQKWYNEKNIVFRKYIDDKRYKDAYELFANHGFNDNSLYVHSEWNLAYVSYLFLKDYNQALIHLNNMERKSSSSVSRARVHYYSGLCLEKLGKMQDAKQEFKKGAEYSMSFYGQLSSAKSEPLIKKISRSYITANNLIDKNDEIYEKVSNHELVKAIFELKKYGQDSLVDVFTTRLGFLFNNKDEMIALANVYKNLNRPDLMVSISRQLRVIGFEMGKPAYPKPSLKIPLFADENLIYAISRQESNFNPKSISGANAMGLMQVLPSTAKEASKRLKEDFSKNRLLNDQDYNILIGSSYIEQLIKKFDGSYILAIAAYNAGPGNVNKWLKTYGKLGESEEDILMWIESIPFTETRNYVQRVLENLYIYRIINAETTSI
ncbi:MAG: Soluble lytic murein transglycosylase precursor [Alphaproteobacteria bacterium ADurb.Bin438]|nr:MAG: Soluble lytic murein transglycosylase precursor [Alphaproteobacteria bacterium ADurb.Bin438]